jgi:2',3'-cyclic-nucleotide 2'-phosphodiesterase (5'-nucleotidase family)
VRLTLLHTNDLHGRQDALARIGTLVAREKAAADHQVLFLDAGDVEETTVRLSNLTKGAAMHRLLGRAGCDVSVVGNACWIRYGPTILGAHAEAASYPILLANFEPVVGAVPSARFGGVGVFGLTAPYRDLFTNTDWGWKALDELEVASRLAAELRADGASFVVLLSHLGLSSPEDRWDDRRIAGQLQGEVDLIVGAHSHDLLPDGEWVGDVLIVQAGQFGEHLGRVELEDGRLTASVEAVSAEIPPLAAVDQEAVLIEAEVRDLLAEPLGEVEVSLDAQWIAEMLRLRMGADVGVLAAAMTLGALPPGVVTRGALWDVSETTANPGVTSMTGGQLVDLLERGNDPGFMAETPRSLRGRPRGPVVSSGLGLDEIDPARFYTVAGTDWELDTFGGYALPEWKLRVQYDFPTIVREAIEEHLREES